MFDPFHMSELANAIMSPPCSTILLIIAGGWIGGKALISFTGLMAIDDIEPPDIPD